MHRQGEPGVVGEHPGESRRGEAGVLLIFFRVRTLRATERLETRAKTEGPRIDSFVVGVL
jgi:hypothetical protein